MRIRSLAVASLASLLAAVPVAAQEVVEPAPPAARPAPPATRSKVTFKDPRGDDVGPGTYKYPTDTVYKKGSYDLTGVTIEKKDGKVELVIELASQLEDPWRFKVGFSLQMVFVFINTDGKVKGKQREGLPGLNVAFSPVSGWDKVVIVSPQSPARVKAEVDKKAGALAPAVVIPTRVRGHGRKITATVDASALPGEPATWWYQVVVQGNEGFPSGNDLLTRRVNEYEGQHRFGGGNDGDCDPHVIDILAGQGAGDAAEVDAQKQMLAYECNDDGSSKQRAMLQMIRAR